MAADSLAANHSRKLTTRKLYRVRKAIVGFSGDLNHMVMFTYWYQKGADLSDRPRDLDGGALVLDGSGIWRYESECYPFPILDEFAAIGSGGDAALAAMYMGATPAEAVEIACRVDLHTGPPVVVESLVPQNPYLPPGYAASLAALDADVRPSGQ